MVAVVGSRYGNGRVGFIDLHWSCTAGPMVVLANSLAVERHLHCLDRFLLAIESLLIGGEEEDGACVKEVVRWALYHWGHGVTGCLIVRSIWQAQSRGA